MNWAMFVRKIREQARSIVIFSLSVAAIQYMIIAIFPTFGGGQGMGNLLQTMPKAFKNLVGGELLAFTGINGFVTMGYTHPMTMVLAAAFAISLPVAALAGEVEGRTVGLILSRPVRRNQMVSSAIAALILGLVTIWVAAWAATAIGSMLVDLTERPDLVAFIRVALNAFALFFLVGSYSLFFSSFAGFRAGSFSIGITVFLYFLNFISGLWEKIEGLGKLFPFHYYDPQAAVIDAAQGFANTGLLIAAAVPFLIAAFIIWERRDLNV